MRMKLGQLVNDLFLKVIFVETIVKGFFKLLELVECYKTQLLNNHLLQLPFTVSFVQFKR